MARKAALIIALIAAPLVAAEDQFLNWMSRVAEGQLAAREAAVARVRTPEEAKARQAAVREKILQLIGGLPDYSGPLNARVTGKVDRPRYVVEKIIFESLPKYYVTANLYRPKAAGRYPGVLLPLGHWENGKPAVQQIAANLALKGFVVLAYDPMGQGERLQAYDARTRTSLGSGSVYQHTQAGAQAALVGETFARYRIWDAKRALDYLVSRPEVETGKIGCTGCSGGGTVTTYIAALDPRITVAAPACFINTWHKLFTGPTGDSEQSVANFLSSGLDVMDYIELFAPKPWLMASTVDDFFPLEGARYAYEESQKWYRVFGAEDRIRWAIGPGGHGTPIQVREAIYEWFIRWLKDGRGDPREEDIEKATDFELQASESGQVGGRETWEVIREGYLKRRSQGTPAELVATIRQLSGGDQNGAVRPIKDTVDGKMRTLEMAIAIEPGLEIPATLYTPTKVTNRRRVLLVDEDAAAAEPYVAAGCMVLSVRPRGLPMRELDTPIGDWEQVTRAWLIGRDLTAMRAGDIVRAVGVLAAQPGENGGIVAAARGVEGVWLLMAAAMDDRLTRIWLDGTPWSIRAALEEPLARNLHAAVIPGFALRWDFDDLEKAMGGRAVVWSDPADWMGMTGPGLAGKVYRVFEEGDGRFIGQLLR